MNYFLLAYSTILQQGWVTLPLSNSYEYEIIEGKGAHSIDEYRQFFFEKGFVVEHQEVTHEIATFKNIEELKGWIRSEIAPKLDLVGDEAFVESYFQLLKARGWIDMGDGEIRLPLKHLVVLLR